MGIHHILYDRRVQEALDAYNAAHCSDLVLRCGPDDLWAFTLTVEALGPQAELPPDLLACLQHAPQSKPKSIIVNE